MVYCNDVKNNLMKHSYKFFGNLNLRSTALYLVLLVACSSFNDAPVAKKTGNNCANQTSISNRDKKFLRLTAKFDNGSKVILKWPAPAEMNVSNFVVQRSADGVNYEDAAMIFAPEENENTIKRYSYSDKIKTVGSETIYYRIKIVDVNGKCTYSDIAIVELDLRDNQFASII
jgi:hypothetical protein